MTSAEAQMSVKDIAMEVIARPSILSLVVEGAITLFIVKHLSNILFWGSVIALLPVLLYRIYTIVKRVPAPYANPKNILITGATSGIGEYIAYHYAKQGAEHIYITGRSTERLARVAAACKTQPGASPSLKVTPLELDVTDVEAMRTQLQAADAATPLDSVYVNAGVSASTLKDVKYEEMARQVIDINVVGILNTVFPLRDAFKERKRGQFVIIASIAGIASLPGNHPYAASKAAAISLGQGFRSELRKFGVGVTVICPGFVRSGMTQERQETMGLPFFMETEPAVQIIARAAAENFDVVSFPFPTALGGWILRVLPFYLHDKIGHYVSKFMYKQ